MSLTEKIARSDELTPVSPSPRPWLLLFSAVLLLAFFVALWGKPGYALSVFGDLAELGFLVIAAVFMIRNAYNSQGATRIFWSFFAAGVILWIAGVLQWTEYELILRTPRPETCLLYTSPSPRD